MCPVFLPSQPQSCLQITCFSFFNMSGTSRCSGCSLPPFAKSFLGREGPMLGSPAELSWASTCRRKGCLGLSCGIFGLELCDGAVLSQRGITPGTMWLHVLGASEFLPVHPSVVPEEGIGGSRCPGKGGTVGAGSCRAALCAAAESPGRPGAVCQEVIGVISCQRLLTSELLQGSKLVITPE